MFQLDGIIFEEVFSAIAEDVSNGKMLYRLSQVSDCSIDVTADSVDSSDKKGNLIKRSYQNKQADITLTNAHLDLNAYAAAAGTKKEVATSGNSITVPKTIRVDAEETSFVLPNVPIDGTLQVASLRNSGSILESYDLGTSATMEEFSYDSSTQTVTFPTLTRVMKNTLYLYEGEGSVDGETVKIDLDSADAYIQDDILYLTEPDSELVEVALSDVGRWILKYDYDSNAAVKVTQNALNFPKTVKLTINALGFDSCDPETLQFFRVVFPRFQPSPETTLEMTTDATFDFSGSAQSTYCDSEKILYSISASDADIYQNASWKEGNVITTHSVRFYNGNTLLDTVTGVEYGSDVAYTGKTPVSSDYPDAEFAGWEPEPVNVTRNLRCYSTFNIPNTEIRDDWDTIISKIEQGTSDYAIGQYKSLDLGDEGVITMEIVAKDTDELADGSGNAQYSWLAKELLPTQHIMNPWDWHSDTTKDGSNEDGTFEEGTGGIGGWEHCEMRSYLKETILPLFPLSLQDAIKTVKKTQAAYDAEGSSFTQTTEDDIWIPTRSELRKAYGDIYSEDSAKVKCAVGTDTPERWWLRNAGGKYNYYSISEDGEVGNSISSKEEGICIGFCM